MFHEDNIILGKLRGSNEYDIILYANRNSTHISIPSNVERIGKFAFGGCKKLDSIEFLENASDLAIGEYSFAFLSIKSFSILSNIKEIEKFTFYRSTKLSSFNFSEDSKLKSIKNQTFASCSINNIVIPKSVKRIEYMAFSDNINLASIEFLSGQLKIENNAFYNCDKLIFVND